MRAATAALLLTLAACGYTDAGDGTNTLEVLAQLDYEVGESNMIARVTVRRTGTHVIGATVKLTDGDTGDSYVLEEDSNQSRYEGRLPGGYHRRLELSVDARSDNVHGRLEGPGAHVVAEPPNDSIVKRDDGAELEVKWKTQDGLRADQVKVALHESDYSTTLEEDHGSLRVARAALRLGPERVQVTRRNRVTLTGGVGQSAIDIGYQADNEFVVE